MTNYVVSRLQPGETLVYRGRPSKIAVFFRPVFFLILTIVLLAATGSNTNGPNGKESTGASIGSFFALLFGIVAIIGLIRAVIFLRTSEYVVTDRRVVGKYGAIRTRSVDVMMTNIAGADIQQGFFARLFHYGNLGIKGSGSSQLLVGIADPTAFQHAVYEQLDRNKLLKGTAGYTLNVRVEPEEPDPERPSSPLSPSGGPASSAFCSQCGSALVPGARFCSHCSAPVVG